MASVNVRCEYDECIILSIKQWWKLITCMGSEKWKVEHTLYCQCAAHNLPFKITLWCIMVTSRQMVTVYSVLACTFVFVFVFAFVFVLVFVICYVLCSFVKEEITCTDAPVCLNVSHCFRSDTIIMIISHPRQKS